MTALGQPLSDWISVDSQASLGFLAVQPETLAFVQGLLSHKHGASGTSALLHQTKAGEPVTEPVPSGERTRTEWQHLRASGQFL